MKKLSININGREIYAYAGQTILEAARENGIFIPTLCEDGRTEIYGACGICVVEAEGNPKLLKACATEIADGMIIRTDTPRVIGSRKTMLELLLSNHVGDCRPPCVHGCPAGTDCQGYVGLVANGEFEEAYRLIQDKIPIPASIGRVCPHPCETECRRGLVDEPVAIARIKRFAGDYALAADETGDWMPEIPFDTGKRAAIIGGGPYGLSLAYFLRRMGHSVTIFEAMPKAGGMLRYGIPEYRLPKAVLDEEIARIASMGVEIVTSTRVGQDISFYSIKSRYDVVCIGVGAWVSTGTGAKGEDLPGVFGGIELLYKAAGGEDIYLGKRVAVVGGGNTAMDACRTAVRMGAKEVYSIYRRTKQEMPAENIEIVEAEEEGVIFKELTNPLEILSDANGRAAKIKLQIMRLGEPDASGRRAPAPVKGRTEMLAVDTVVLAVGQAANPSSLGVKGLKLTKKKGVAYDPETFTTSVPGVFAGGDCGNDKVSIAVEAIADAKHSASVINAYLFGEKVLYDPGYTVKRGDITERTFEGRERLFRPPVDILPLGERKRGFAEVAAGWDDEFAETEAMRCLECGCADFFECKLIDYARMYDVAPERFAGAVSVAAEDGALPPPDADKDGHPFIEREEGKCILCGLCVRVCEQVVGASALGFSGRGFDTDVSSAFGVSLEESGCLSCGICASVCPTGAMRERLSLKKSIPVETYVTETTCPHCSIGCQIYLETCGDLLVKAKPSDGKDGKGLICGRGKFGFDCSELYYKSAGARLTSPLMRDGVSGELQAASWYDAFVAAAKKTKSVRANYGPGSTAVSVSDRLTNEEAYAARSLSASLGARVFSFNNRASAAAKIFGAPPSVSYEELLNTDYILSAGFDAGANPALALMLRKAADAGTKIVSIETTGAALDDAPGFGASITREIVKSANNLTLLSGIEAALLGEKAPVLPSRIAGELKAAKKAMFVYQRNVLTEEAAEALCRIALLSGHEGSPRDGVMEILPKCNSRGLYDLEITATAADIFNSEYGAGVKSLFIVGEDPVGQIEAARKAGAALPEELKAAKKLIAQVQFVVVCDTHMTATAKLADVVIPMTGFASVDGTYTNTEGRLLGVEPAVACPTSYANWEVFRDIQVIAGSGVSWESEADLSRELSDAAPAYRYAELDTVYSWPDTETAKTAAKKVAARKKAQKTNGRLVSPLPTSDHLTRRTNERLGPAVYGN